MKKVAVLFLIISLLLVSCISTKKIDGSSGTIEYKGEVNPPPLEESSTETILESPGEESEVITEDFSVVEPIESDESVESEAIVTEIQNPPLFQEMTEDEKQDLSMVVQNAEDVNYVYTPSDPDVAKIGSVDIPKWFAYLCTGIIIATLLTMCYIANQSKKKMYYGRRD
ncbi:MAG: hypothetical protein ACI4XN_07345 [Candidatus Kurthia intestinigallinarum]